MRRLRRCTVRVQGDRTTKYTRPYQYAARFLHRGHCRFHGPSDMNSFPQTRHDLTLRSRCKFLNISRSAAISFRFFCL